MHFIFIVGNFDNFQLMMEKKKDENNYCNFLAHQISVLDHVLPRIIRIQKLFDLLKTYMLALALVISHLDNKL